MYGILDTLQLGLSGRIGLVLPSQLLHALSHVAQPVMEAAKATENIIGIFFMIWIIAYFPHSDNGTRPARIRIRKEYAVYFTVLKNLRIASAVVQEARRSHPPSARKAREMVLISCRYGVCCESFASVSTIILSGELSIVS